MMGTHWTVALLIGAMGLAAGTAARTDAVPLTGGVLQFYLGDPGSAHLVGDGLDVSSMANGGWPRGVRPGDVVNFSTDVDLFNWGPATVSGMRLQGDPSGPGAGRVWIAGSLHVAAKPFVAPPASGSDAQFSAPVIVSGTVSGYYNANAGQSPLFTLNVAGHGIASGGYRSIDTGSGDISYLASCCASIAISPSGYVYQPFDADGRKIVNRLSRR